MGLRIRPYEKFGLILMVCLICIVLLGDFFIVVINEQNLNHSVNRSSQRNFNETFLTFPWDDFENAVAKNLAAEGISVYQLLMDELAYFVALEPSVSVKHECKPPSLPLPTEINCTLYPDAFNGVKRANPAKVGALIQFGFDVDVLEIHMNELYGVVDKYFIIEATRAHFGNIKKPLKWERVQRQARFKKFPVIHFIVDDADSSNTTNNEWSMESLQERLRWRKFMEWNAATKYFSDEDVIGFGDADEIPSRAKLNMFKYCEMREASVDFGIWFPFGHINQAFESDYPVKSHNLTLGDPTYYTLSSAKLLVKRKPNVYPNRRRGRSRNYMLGGIHMSHYGYLPFRLLNYVAASERGLRTILHVQHLAKYLKAGDILKMEVDFAATPKRHMARIKKVNLTDSEMREICVLPWFYDCNRDRYPVWEDGHDTRLD